MQSVSQTFKSLFAKRSRTVEVRAIVDGETYGMGDLYGVTITRTSLAEGKPSVGGTCAAELRLSVVPRKRIPRMAEIKIEVRITTDTEESEWIPKGTFYVDSRSGDGERVDITAYDAMLKAEQEYAALTSLDGWGNDENDVVAEIAKLMGVEVDTRTELKGYIVPYPQDYTMREVLGYIAAANAGNWVITDDSKLRLVKLAGAGASILAKDHETGILMGDTLILLSSGASYKESISAHDATRNIERNVASFKNLGKTAPYTGVTVWWADESAKKAGDDSGTVLEFDCPWATQGMAGLVLDEIEGYTHQGAEAQEADLTPAAELGDVIVCDGTLFLLEEYTVSFDGTYLPDISAPTEMEVDSEYHYESKTTRELARRAKLGESYYGVKLSRENGIEIIGVTSEDKETSRAVFNADTLEFYDDNGKKVLWFEPTQNRYYFEGDVDVSGQISSPIIEGDEIKVYGFFGVYNPAGTSLQGYIGAATGSGDSPTSGVALSYGTKTDRLTDDDNYIIATDSGVRMQAGGAKLYVIASGAYVNDEKIVTQPDIQNFVTAQGVEDILRQYGLIT